MTFEEFVIATHEILDEYSYTKLDITNHINYYVVQAMFSSIESINLDIHKWWNVEEYKNYLKSYIKYIDR